MKKKCNLKPESSCSTNISRWYKCIKWKLIKSIMAYHKRTTLLNLISTRRLTSCYYFYFGSDVLSYHEGRRRVKLATNNSVFKFWRKQYLNLDYIVGMKYTSWFIKLNIQTGWCATTAWRVGLLELSNLTAHLWERRRPQLFIVQIDRSAKFI